MICGNNGQGKTNLLEAIWLLTGGKSFRGGKDAELVRGAKPSPCWKPSTLRAQQEGREPTSRTASGMTVGARIPSAPAGTPR